jgi:hypothetical protein
LCACVGNEEEEEGEEWRGRCIYLQRLMLLSSNGRSGVRAGAPAPNKAAETDTSLWPRTGRGRSKAPGQVRSNGDRAARCCWVLLLLLLLLLPLLPQLLLQLYHLHPRALVQLRLPVASLESRLRNSAYDDPTDL